MRRSPASSLQDILDAIQAIEAYTGRKSEIFEGDPMVRDAVAARLIHIGQAVKDAQAQGLDLPVLSPGIPWRSIAGMRDRLAHRYWLVEPAIVWSVIETDLPKLAAAVRKLIASLDAPKGSRRRAPAKKKLI